MNHNYNWFENLLANDDNNYSKNQKEIKKEEIKLFIKKFNIKNISFPLEIDKLNNEGQIIHEKIQKILNKFYPCDDNQINQIEKNLINTLLKIKNSIQLSQERCKMNKVFSKMFLWMFLGLMVTFGVAYFLSQNDTMMYNLFSGKKYLIVWIAEIVVVLVLSLRIHKLSLMSARILFILYSLLTGLTVSTIFIVYSISSIIYVFLITSILFLIFGLIGYFTKIDLSRFGTILAMALLGGIICTIINIFIKSETFDFATTLFMIVVFLGYIAYDINKVKNNFRNIEDEDKLAIYGALELYLDFINLFLRLLRLFGKSND